MENCCESIVKYFMVLFNILCCESISWYFMVLCNILFALAGLALIGFGAYVQIATKDYLNFLGDHYVNTPIFIIILGGLIFAIAFFGCCGAWQEKKLLIYTYTTLLVIVIIAQIGAAIAAFVLKGDLKMEITKNMKNGLRNYDGEGFKGVTLSWDMVQKELKCCGVENYKDWKNVTEFSDGGVPDSCCIVEGCGIAPVDPDKVFSDGCFTLFSDEFVIHLSIIGAVAAGIALGEMIAIAFACCLCKRVGHRLDYTRLY